jgi:hypothetical protein
MTPCIHRQARATYSPGTGTARGITTRPFCFSGVYDHDEWTT